jgi:hypothetical protein
MVGDVGKLNPKTNGQKETVMKALAALPAYTHQWQTFDGTIDIERVYIHKGVRIIKNTWREQPPAEVLTAVKLHSVQNRKGWYYSNPKYFLEATPGVPLAYFMKQVRRAQKLWNQMLARHLGSTQRKRQAKKAKPLERRLKFTGILQIDGRQPGPKEWPDVLVPC